MLANAHIPVFAIVLGFVIAVLTVVPSLAIEAVAVRNGVFRDINRLRTRGLSQNHPSFLRAVGYAFAANVASTLPGFVTAFYFLDVESHLIWLVHYAITVAIELPVYYLFGIRLTKKFLAFVLVANAVTYGIMYLLIATLG